MDTYKSAAEGQADRDAQQTLLTALHASPLALRRDECGSWRITGKNGHISACADSSGFVLYLCSGSVRKWTADRKRLSFCTVTQEGDDEGCLRLFGLPTPDQADAIRIGLGIRKRANKSEETIAAEQKRLAGARNRNGTAGIGGVPAVKSARPGYEVLGYPSRSPRKFRWKPTFAGDRIATPGLRFAAADVAAACQRESTDGR